MLSVILMILMLIFQKKSILMTFLFLFGEIKIIILRELATFVHTEGFLYLRVASILTPIVSFVLIIPLSTTKKEDLYKHPDKNHYAPAANSISEPTFHTTKSLL